MGRTSSTREGSEKLSRLPNIPFLLGKHLIMQCLCIAVWTVPFPGNGKEAIRRIVTKFPQLVPLGTICVGPSAKRRILWKYVRFSLPAAPDSAARKAVTSDVS